MAKTRKPQAGMRKKRRNSRLRNYKRSVLMICAVLICLTGALGVGAFRLHAKSVKYQKQEAELENQIADEKERSEEVKKFEQYVKTDDYIKQTAEDKLNLVDPDEIIFKPSK